jgi:hypothetical protein
MFSPSSDINTSKGRGYSVVGANIRLRALGLLEGVKEGSECFFFFFF